jgi:hypothetical protein
MHITYCSVCGARMQSAASKAADVKCDDCVAGKPRRPTRRGDSAHLRRRSTSRMLKQIPPEKPEKS